MERRGSEETARRRPSVPELIRRHSSLLASLAADGPLAEGSRAEQRRSSTTALEREFPNLRATPRPSTCQSIMEEEPQSLSIEELEQLLENCTKLTRDNQLTEGRLWGLSLPQHMPELAKRNADEASFDFQKVSFGLDAAVQIYSKRVDSMHNAALDTRSRLTHQQRNEGAAVEAAEVEMTVRRRIRRQSDFGGDSTLVSNLDTITMKEDAEDAPPLDPLFHKTCALFDAGGFKGLPSLNLGIKRGGRYVLDMSEVPDQMVHQGYDLPLGHKLDLEAFGTRLETMLEMKSLSQSSKKLYSLLNRPECNHSIQELIQRGMNAVTLLPQPVYPEENRQPPGETGHWGNGNGEGDEALPEQGAADDEDFPLGNPLDFPDEGSDAAVADEGPSLPAQEFDDAMDEDGLLQMDEENENEGRITFNFNPAAVTVDGAIQVDLLDEDTISWLLDPNPDKNRARTGASHWKYPTISHNSAPEKETSPPQRRREAKNEIDFTLLPETDLSKFKKPAKESSIITQFRDDATHLRPTDHGFNASFLLQLPLMPSKRPQEWLRGRRPITQPFPASGDPMGLFEEGDDFPDADDGHWAEFAAEDDDLDFGLVQAPPQIEEDAVYVETLPSRVNMGQIKTTLWSTIEEAGSSCDQTEGVPFEAVVHDVIQSTEVSFGICFVCLLHLAVEHHFEIVNTSEGDVSIVLNRME